MKNFCVWFFDSFTWYCMYCLYFSVMLCYNCSQFVVQFIEASLLNFRCSKTVMKAIEQDTSRMIAIEVQSKTQSKNLFTVQSRVQSPCFTLLKEQCLSLCIMHSNNLNCYSTPINLQKANEWLKIFQLYLVTAIQCIHGQTQCRWLYTD